MSGLSLFIPFPWSNRHCHLRVPVIIIYFLFSTTPSGHAKVPAAPQNWQRVRLVAYSVPYTMGYPNNRKNRYHTKPGYAGHTRVRMTRGYIDSIYPTKAVLATFCRRHWPLTALLTALEVTLGPSTWTLARRELKKSALLTETLVCSWDCCLTPTKCSSMQILTTSRSYCYDLPTRRDI